MPASEQRWSDERSFFDAEQYSEGPIPEAVIQRYARCRKPFLPAEYPFWLLGDVRGKSVLEVGCGDGANSILLALKGARVVGLDISPKAVAVANQRARLHGVSGSCEFHALPVELFVEHAHDQYDIICGFAVLHHVLPVLDQLMANLMRLAHDKTVFLFKEPVLLSGLMKILRRAVPIRVHGTPDERPLEQGDLAIVRRHLPDLEVRTFNLLGRVWARFVRGPYEGYSAVRRTMADALCRFDAVLLSLPIVRRTGSIAVLVSRSRST
jgi:SAM-dependent methyltransferase